MSTNISLWVDYIGEQSVPLFKGTVEMILGNSQNDEITFKEVAEAILRDASLTARVIKIANSAFYNRTEMHIHDVRRAVMIIGFDKINEICLTTAIIEALLRKSTRNHVFDLMAQSFYAAVYAKSIAKEANVNDLEEIFISALLFDYGELAFWSLSGNAGEEIEQKLTLQGCSAEQAQRDLLGVTFRDLTLGICNKWNLTSLLPSVLAKPESRDAKVQSISLGRRLAEFNMNFNDLKKSKKLLSAVGELINKNQTDTLNFIKQRIKEASQITYLHLSYDSAKKWRL